MDITDNWFEYLHTTRKLSAKVISEAGLFVSDNWLAIPIYDETGTVIFNKYRRAPWMDSSLPKYKYEKGSTAHLYGIEHAFTAKEVYIVEGEMDVLALRTLGYVGVSSTGGALTFREEWGEMLKGSNINVMLDNDIAGLKGSIKIAMILKNCTFRWIPPMYGKDTNDVLMNFGEEKCHEIITGTDNILTVSIPPLESESQIKKYRKELSDTLKGMSSGSVGTMFLRELIVQLSCMASDLKKKKRKTPLDDSRLAFAKSYPIENLIKVGTDHKAFCPFHQHNHQTPSLHVYPNNTFYCFACSKYGDVLTLYGHLNNMDVADPMHFRLILEKLCNLNT